MKPNIKKILFSLMTIGVIAVVAVAASQAFFNDTESSLGNVFRAGALDLKIDNTSYLNSGHDGTMVLVPGLTWALSDLTNQLFFNYNDLKPGDLGEDTVSLHVTNPSWACIDIRITENDDETCTNSELVDDATCNDPDGDLLDGELAQNLEFSFWRDDGDNVLEVGETVATNGPASNVLNGVKWALGEPNNGGLFGGALDPANTYYIGKAWCFGDLVAAPVAQDGDNTSGPNVRGAGFTCNGALVNNASQTDVLKGDIRFYAEQARNNAQFDCDNVRLPVTPP